MITTVTANPSLDRTLHIATFQRGTVHRAEDVLLEPSGKGVNVALALAAAGVDVTAVLPVGGPAGHQLAAMLDAAGLPHLDVPIAGSVRSNVTLVEEDGTTTKINEPGPRLSAAEVSELIAASLRPGSRGDWVTWCGSLPAGCTDQDLVRAVARAHSVGRRVAVDTSGSALTAVLTAEGPPDLVKPNADELAESVGRALPTVGDVADAAAELVRRGVGTVLVSLGGDGAVLADREGILYGWAPVDQVVNTVGAGDALLAGYLMAGYPTAGQPSTGQPSAGAGQPGADRVDRLTSALRAGAAAVQRRGTTLSGPPDPNGTVHLGAPPRERRLST